MKRPFMTSSRWRRWRYWMVLWMIVGFSDPGNACEWGVGEDLRRFVRVREDAPLGHTILAVNVTQPHLLTIQSTSQESSGIFRVEAPEGDAEGGAAVGDGASWGVGRVVVGVPLQPLQQEDSTVTKLTLVCGSNQVPMQVTVYVEDVNDHEPTFLDKNVTVTVDELTPVGLTILQEIRVRDGDKPNTANSEVDLQLVSGNDGQHFTLADRKRGIIKLSKALDYDAGPKLFFLGIMAKDMGTPSLSSTATVTVIVLDADDSPPVFSYAHYTARIAENPGPDTETFTRQEVDVQPEGIHAYDGDVGRNVSLKYSMVDSPSAHFFTLHPDTGRLYLSKHLDRENLSDSTLTLHIRAEQEDNPRRVASSVVEIEVEDVNDNLPRFTHDVYSISIVENLPSGFSVVQVSATDPDEGVNRVFNYHVVGGNGALTVNPLSGWLTVANHNILDRETSPQIDLHVCANQLTPLVTYPGSPASKLSLIKNSEIPMSNVTEGFRNSNPTSTIRPANPILVSTTRPPNPISISTTSRPSNPILISTTTPSTSPSVRPANPTGLSTRRPFISRRLKSVRPLFNRTRSAIVNTPDVDKKNDQENSGSRVVLPRFRRIGQQATSRSEASSTIAEPERVQRHGFGRRIKRLRKVNPVRIRNPVEPQNAGARAEADVLFAEERRRIIKRRSRARDALRSNAHTRRSRRETRPSRIVLIRRKKSKSSDVMPETESSSCAKIELKLLDANDNNPVFIPSNQYQVTLTEAMQPGHIIGKVTAEDQDEGGNGQVVYRIQGRGQSSQVSTEGAIGVDKFTGNLTLISKYPPGDYTVFIEALDSPSNPSETRTSLAVVNIKVESGTGPSEPRFIGAPYELWVGNDAPVGTSIGQVRVMDMDEANLLFDMFHPYQEGVPFAIEETSGIVSVMSPIREFSRTSYFFEAVVTDGRSSLASNLTVHVAPSLGKPVANRRDNIINFTIQENLSGGLVGDVILELRNMGVRLAPDPQFELVSPEARKYFALAQDATLYTVAPLDYEAHPNHTLVVVSARTSDIFYVNVQVEDVNDNPPQLNAVNYEGLIRENAIPGTVVRLLPTIQVSDADKYAGSTYSLHLFGEAADLFSIDLDGTIRFIGSSLDREAVDVYRLRLEARDDGNLTSQANLSIIVEDINDNRPNFSQKEALFSSRQGEENNSRKLPDASNLKYLAELERSLIRIPETLPIGSQVTKVTATDNDASIFADIRYGIEIQRSFEFSSSETNTPPRLQESNTFSIEAKTGIVVVTGVLEPDHFYIFNISATDGGGLSSYTTVAIAVFDVNNNPPQFEQQLYNFQVSEGEYLVGEVGKVLALDKDLGDNGKVRYQIIFLNDTAEDDVFPFRIVETSGTILASGTVDRERKDVYEFSVVATDMGEPELSSSVLIHIDVTDVNDHAPMFYGYQEALILPDDSSSSASHGHSSSDFTPVYIAIVSESTPRNTPISQVFANDSDSDTSGNGIILYKLEGSEDKFAIDSKNGTVYTVGDLDFERWPSHNLTIVAQDLGSPPLTSTSLLSVTVIDVEEELTTRLFEREEYRIVVEENNITPLRLLDLNVTDAYTNHKLRYYLVDEDLSGVVAVDATSGQVYLTASLDRETRDSYRFKVKAVQPDRARSLDSDRTINVDRSYLEYLIPTPDLFTLSTPEELSTNPTDVTPPVRNSSEDLRNSRDLVRTPAEIVPLIRSSSGRRGRKRLQSSLTQDDPQESSTKPVQKFLSMDEVWVKIIVRDQNDNSPKFIPHGRPIVAAVPSTAAYGHFVTRITAHDPDLGLNGEVRYEILPGEGAQDASTRFTVDPTTGQVVVVGSLSDEAGKMFGFDVRATDMRGAPAGRTAIANVFVHVLGHGRHLVVEVGATPRDVEPHLMNLQGMLANVSGLDVRIQRIAPHVEGDAAHTTATDVYVYAVDPVSQAVVEAAELRQALSTRKGKLRKLLPSGLPYKGMRFPVPPREGHVLQTAELAILIGAVVVFLVTVTTVVCLCYKQRKRRRKPMPLPPMMAAAGMPVMPLAYPGPFGPAGAPYTHMSDHSSADSSETPDMTHDQALYHQEVTHYPHAAVHTHTTHYPRQPPRRRSCAHTYQGDHELLHSGNSERVSSHTDEDDSAGASHRNAASKKRRRGNGYPGGAVAMGGGGGSKSFSHHDRALSRSREHFRDSHSSSDLDERDHAPPQVNIPRPQKCCAEDRQRVNPNLPRGMTTIDCSLESSTRPHTPDSLERPRSRQQNHHHQHRRSRSQSLHRTPTHRERVGGKPLLHPSDITEL